MLTDKRAKDVIKSKYKWPINIWGGKRTFNLSKGQRNDNRNKID